MALDEAVQQELTRIIEANEVVLFMKGNRQAPQCGFSATVVGILDSILPSYHTVDVLSAPEIREGIKVFSSWPTIPQLYVKGEFVGGCDIVTEMTLSGELDPHEVQHACDAGGEAALGHRLGALHEEHDVVVGDGVLDLVLSGRGHRIILRFGAQGARVVRARAWSSPLEPSILPLRAA